MKEFKMDKPVKHKIAIIIPAYNEELTIKNVIMDFWNYPDRHKYNYNIYVLNNNSTDNTNEIANQTFLEHEIAGQVMQVKRIGKANVIKFAFNKINADAYIMIDADSTYWCEDINKFIDPILVDGVDMVIGDRISTGSYRHENKRPFHNFGNGLVKKIINSIFKANLKDIMTGYRGFSYRFVKNYPILYEGFELETDMSIFCLEHKFNLLEVPIKFTDRPQGSFSKLNTYYDGIKIIFTIFNLFRNYKPLQFFSMFGFILLICGLVAGSFPISNYIETRYVQQIPMAILSVGLVITSMLLFAIGLILSSVKRYQNINFEMEMLRFSNNMNGKVTQ